MLLLLGWQAIYGYVYQQLAIIIAAFMAGMAAGSWAALRFPPAGAMRALGRWQLAVSLAPLVLCGLFEAFTRVTSPAGLFLVSQIVFPALALSCGILGGYEFPLASRIFFASGRTRGAGTGTLYALDLAGSCLGAILFSAWLVPVFGFFKTAVLSALVSMAPAALAILSAPAGRETHSQG
jgi:predicted membrane-bound spermidine synthase